VALFVRHRSSPTATLVPGAADVRELAQLARAALAQARHA
jgi:hypothetical protein